MLKKYLTVVVSEILLFQLNRQVKSTGIAMLNISSYKHEWPV
jgi:hypothetical protein